MKGFRRVAAGIAALAWAWAAAAGTPGAAGAAEVGPVPEAVLESGYLTDLAQELYWWYLDEEDLEMRRGGGFRFMARRLAPDLDEGDQSEWAEVRVPAFRLGVVLKRPDYRIEETGAEVRGRHFRMTEVFRLEPGGAPTDGLPGGPWTRVEFGAGEMLRRVRERIGELRFPDPVLTERLHKACRRQMELDVEGRESGDQVIHIAPLSDVANEVWVYIENQCWLMQFSSDREIENPDGWSWEDLRARVWSLRDNTVAALGEMPGSNLAMTMDQAGRALYNCVVLGKRLVVVNPDDPDGEALVREHVWSE
ncbi:MAG: hypothetical protein IK066_05520 [Kiritimatiellae bacterium]|nr:hypothetical protein [Kiritimatiellia bacterium]